jgi:hypothetical protein
MAIVEDHPSHGMRSKLQGRGKPALFKVQHTNTPRDTYRFLNLLTNCIIISRDVIWLKQSYGEFYSISPLAMPANWTRSLITTDEDGPIEAREVSVREVSVPPGIPEAVEEEDFVETLSDEDKYNFVSEKNVLLD